ncbi:MAG: Hsp70 family protein [Nitrososphaerota archaeon]|jgi:molecular chaperone DnaK|nr:Hsp70 family protein [Nitrososphaerota archaeon]
MATTATEKILGIDLGTTNSAAAVYEGSGAVPIPSQDGAATGGKMFPSVVAFMPDGSVVVGEKAKRQMSLNPHGTVLEIKRKMGTEYRVEVGGKKYSPEEISSLILRKIRSDSEAYLGATARKAVITIPAHFNDNQRQATMEAGAMAGLEVLRIINEPTAACLAYGLDRAAAGQGKMRIMVFSFGGGTHDVTTMEIDGDTYKVLATSGDTQTGGADIDNAIVQRLANRFYNENDVNLRDNPSAMVRLKEAAEKAKIDLSTELSVEVGVPFLATVEGVQKHLKYELTQAELEEIAFPIVRKVEATIRSVLIDSRLGPEDIDKLILIGGQTKMPLVRRTVEQYMGKAAEEGVDPMQCVAIGAAYQGAVLAGKLNYKLLDVTPLTLGVEDAAGTVQRVIYRNTPIPVSRTQSFTTAEDDQTEVGIHVIQGERTMAADCVSIGRFNLEGFAPRARGATQILVGFDIDANGILNVSAKELASGVERTVNITGRMKIPEEERRRLIEESKLYSGLDRARREEALLKGNGDQLVYKAKKVQEELLLPKERIEKLDRVCAEVHATAALPLDPKNENGKLDAMKAKLVELADLINDTIDTYEMGEAA